MQNIKFKENFYLTIKDVKTLSEVALVPKSLPTNFIFVIDVSGSMSYELNAIRTQLKNKLPQLVKESDTVTIVWFSGRNDAGILMEEIEIKSLKKLQDINSAIDRFLRPIGATAFHKPLVLAKEAIGRIKKNRPDGVFSLIFLTDGCNNDCSMSDVMKSLKTLEPDLASSTFVEYGYYADSEAIAKMAELVGGEKVVAEQFDEYDVVFESKLQKTYGSSKKVLVDLPKNRLFDFAFTVSPANEIILYGVNDDQVLVPEDTISLLFFTSKAASNFVLPYENKAELNKLVYSALYVLTEKLQSDYAEDVFKTLGDKNLYEIFTNAFGKQKLMNFKNLIKECVFDNTKQFLKGRVENLVADENAYCVMDFINDLTSDENALIYPLHPEFSYKRIGAKKVQASGQLNEEQKKKLSEAKSVEELKALTDEIAESNPEALKFEYNDKNKGYSISNLVWSSERANLSINVKFDGYVELPENKFGIGSINTFIFRNYTIIKDGILNITRVPVRLSSSLFEKFKSLGLVSYHLDMGIDEKNMHNVFAVLEFGSLPTINRRMVKKVSAKKLAELEFNLLKLQGLAKAYKYYEGLHFPKVSKGFVDEYGAEAEAWLKELGITSYNGFAPKMTTEKSTDFYMAVELNTKIAKYSAIPTVASVIKKIDDGKALTPADELLKPAIDDYNTQINSSLYKSLKDEKLKNDVLENWLKTSNKEAQTKRKQYLQEIAQIKFALILSKRWFEEFKSLDEDTLNYKVDGKDLTVKFEMTETQVNL